MPRQLFVVILLMLAFAGAGSSVLLTHALAQSKKLPAVQQEKAVGPKPTPGWYWRWSQWRLGEGYAQGRPLQPGLRPKHAPQRIPQWAWQRLHFFRLARAQRVLANQESGKNQHGRPPTVSGTKSTSPTTTITTTTAPLTTPTTATTSLLFDDEFNGSTGAPPDPSKWYVLGDVCPHSTHWTDTCLKRSNAFQDGRGDLVLRVSGGTLGRPYDGAEISPSPMNGYPSTNVKYKFPAGSRLEIRAKFAPGVGLWETLWSVAPDSVTQDVLELDMQEWRGNHPTLDDCHTHYSVEYGSEPNTGQDLSAGWHTYWMDYYRDHVVFGMDNMTCGQTPLTVAPAETPILWNMVAPPSTGAGAGGPPPASDIPADMLVDYVRVSAIS